MKSYCARILSAHGVFVVDKVVNYIEIQKNKPKTDPSDRSPWKLLLGGSYSSEENSKPILIPKAKN